MSPSRTTADPPPPVTSDAAVGQMLEGHDILVIGGAEWLLLRTTPEETTLQLARRNRVLFVEPFRSIAGLVREARRQRRDVQIRSGLRQVDGGLWVYSPPPLGVPGTSRWDWAAEVNGLILGRVLLPRVMRRLGFVNPIVWSFRLESSAVVRRLPRRLSVYECVDHYEALASAGPARERVRELEARTCRLVDLVFGITAELVDARRHFNAHMFEVTGGTDLEHAERALRDDTVVPPDLARLGGPVIGYAGSLDPFKMDLPLITAIARARPHWKIVFVGYVWYGFDAAVFREFPNIHVLGPKRRDEFPGYLKGMDVCIMPYPLNDITRNGDSVKCYDYLAAGKPVVSTPVPTARRFPGVVRIAEDADAFIAAIDASLAEPAEAVERRRRAVASYTWERRTVEASELVRRRLAELQSSVSAVASVPTRVAP